MVSVCGSTYMHLYAVYLHVHVCFIEGWVLDPVCGSLIGLVSLLLCIPAGSDV